MGSGSYPNLFPLISPAFSLFRPDSQLYDNIRKAILPLMHEEATAVMRCLSEEVEKRSRKQQGNNTSKSRKQKQNMHDGEEEKKECHEGNGSSDIRSSVIDPDFHDKTNLESSKHTNGLADFSDEQLVAELTRRRAEKYRLHGAMIAKKGFIPHMES
jgi:hypothetical protein